MLSRRRRSISEKVPLDILVNILYFLSISDQVCFSISCKYLYGSFLVVLRIHEIDLSKLLPFEKRPVLCYNNDVENRPRIQLLRRLEDSRWEYCQYCWAVHPRHTWCSQVLGLRLPRRFHYKPIVLNLQLSNELQPSILHAGKVDIRPCPTITFPDKLHLKRTISTIRNNDTVTCEYYYNNILYRPVIGIPDMLCHDCEALTGDPSTKLQVRTWLWVDQATQDLRVTNTYTFGLSDNSLIRRVLVSGRKAPFTPPHEETRRLLRRFFNKSGSSFSGWHESDPDTCTSFSTCSFEVLYDIKAPETFKLSVRRNLGNDEWPNDVWKQNCRSPRKTDVGTAVSEVSSHISQEGLRLSARLLYGRHEKV